MEEVLRKRGERRAATSADVDTGAATGAVAGTASAGRGQTVAQPEETLAGVGRHLFMF